MIYNKNTVKDAARLSLAKWYNQVTNADSKSFNTISATVYTHYEEILNFLPIEVQMLQLKAFRASLRGVVDIKFFLFRLAKIYG